MNNHKNDKGRKKKKICESRLSTAVEITKCIKVVVLCVKHANVERCMTTRSACRSMQIRLCRMSLISYSSGF